MSWLRRFIVPIRLAIAGVAAIGLNFVPVLAGVTTHIDQREHLVYGTTARALVSSMNANPIQGDHGGAYASVHPNYVLSVATTNKGGLCRAKVDVSIRFVMTLPKAANLAAMNGRTRNAWNSFVGFARNHENHHRASYTSCAKTFVARAERMSDKQCFALSADIRQAFNQMKSDCEASQLDFDRAQRQVVPRLSLFSMARYERFH